MVQVTVSEGILEGELVEDELATYYSFKGIPYAAPPVGELRFKPPEPAIPWEGIRPATEFGAVSYQFDFATKGMIGSEDCLFLNVYSPDISPEEPLPVMVWIHGGAFKSGSGNDDAYGPEFLVRKDIILVTINYRLEVIGFLCLDSEDVPGNAGMKDQVAALRWVKENIQNFGGDPDNVTIFGESAGGASVSALTLSPMSKGLFKKAIAQSGTTNAGAPTWYPFQAALALARKLDFFSEDKTELYEFLKNQPAEKLLGAQNPFNLYDLGRGFSEVNFGIVPEQDFGQDRFLLGDPYEMLRDGIHEGVDVIVGYNEDEGTFFSAVWDMVNTLNKIKMFDDFLVPLHIAQNVSQKAKFEVGRRLKEFYFKKTYEPAEEKINQIFKYATTNNFVYGIVQYAKFCSCSNKNNIYMYKFTCKSERNFMSYVYGIRKHLGNRIVVTHTDDLPYLFPVKMSGFKVDKDSETFKLIDRFTTLWTNFAKYGNPTPDDSFGVNWNPYTIEGQDYMEIGNELRADVAPEAEEVELYEQLFKEFGPDYVFQPKI